MIEDNALIRTIMTSVNAHPNELHVLLSALKDSDLIEFIEHLLCKEREEAHYTTVLEQTLLLFCQRLHVDKNPETALHQWEQKPYTAQLVQQLLQSPECVYRLSTANTALYRWITWSTPAQELKHRIDAVLNNNELTAEQVQYCTLLWLNHFRTRPEQLHTLFANLNQSKKNRTPLGERTLDCIKHNFWELLRPGALYEEKGFLTLFSPPVKELLLGPELAAQLFSSVHLKTDDPTPLLNCHQWIKDKDKDWIKQFIRAVSAQIKTISTHLVALYTLDTLLLHLIPQLKVTRAEDRTLISSYLHMILQLIQSTKEPQYIIELKQLVANLLTAFSDQEEWSPFLRSQTVVNEHSTLEQSDVDQEQLLVLRYSYHADDQNEERLLYLLEQEQLPVSILAPCMNSYAPVIVDQEMDIEQFLNLIKQQSKNPEKMQTLIEALNETLIIQVMVAALKHPERATTLLEHILCSDHRAIAQQQLRRSLSLLIKQATEPQPETLSQLNSEQLNRYPPEQLHPLLIVQRLLFYAQPLEEFHSFISAHDQSIKQAQARALCADISLYNTLITLQKVAAYPMDSSMTWLSQHGVKALTRYQELMDCMQTDIPLKQPSAFFNYLGWKAFIYSSVYNDKSILLKAFLLRLAHLDSSHTDSTSEIQQLLYGIAEQQQLAQLFQNITATKNNYSTEQLAWLCTKSLEMMPEETSTLPYIIELSSWNWLTHQKNHHPQLHAALLKEALQNPRYLTEINKSEQQQEQFLLYVEQSQLSTQYVLELIQGTNSLPIKSLLIIALLQQQKHLEHLQGSSILNRINTPEARQPSRLNPLIHAINNKLLTKERIKKLPPEAAFSLLCSLPHFHQLSIEQLRQVLEQLPQPAAAIYYWLKHYASMPNAHFILAHLMALAEQEIMTALNNLEQEQQEQLRLLIVTHLELFNPHNLIIQEMDKEHYLIHAIQRYINGHQHPSYRSFIHRVAEQLIQKRHSFSLQASQLLIDLQDKAEFQELNTNTAYLMNHYLKSNAQLGAIEVFYDGAVANISTMTQLIPLQPKQADSDKSKSLFAHLLSPVLANEGTPVLIPERVHPLITVLAEHEQYIKAFDYFLIHYKGSVQTLDKALHDYLGFYAQDGCSKNQRRALYHTSTLMTRCELEPSIRDTIFTAFLSYPNLYDEHISHCLFLCNAPKILQHFGLQGSKESYHQVIHLCTLVLKKLDPNRHQDLIEMALQAQSEAKIELTFAEEDSILSRLFNRFKRCWLYGWTGFFSPNTPEYVAPFSYGDKKTSSVPTNRCTLGNFIQKPRKDLTHLLTELNGALTVDKLNELLHALNQWSPQIHDDEERKTRVIIHHLFHEIIIGAQKDKMLELWLKKNQQPLIDNRFRLLELTLQLNSVAETQVVVQQMYEDSPHFHTINEELRCRMPEQNLGLHDLKNGKTNTPPIASAGFLNSATTLVQTAWSWTTGFNFFATPVPTKAESTATEPLSVITFAEGSPQYTTRTQ